MLTILTAAILAQFPAPMPAFCKPDLAISTASGIVDWRQCLSGIVTAGSGCTGSETAAVPSGVTVSWTRNITENCGESVLYQASANDPCVTTGGAMIWSASASGNLLTYSDVFENAAWTKDAGVSVDDESALCPIGPRGTRMSLVTGDAAGEGVSQDAATGTARSIWLAYPTAGSACAVTLSDASGDGWADTTLTASPVRSSAAWVGHSGIKTAKASSSGCATWCQQAASSSASLVVGPYVNTTTAAIPGANTVVSVPAVSGVTNASGAVGIRFTTNGNAYKRPLGFGTTANGMYLTGGTVHYEDGTSNVATAAAFWATGVETTLLLWWSGSTACMSHVDLSGMVCGAYDGSWGTWSTFSLGSLAYSSGSAFLDGSVKKFCQDKELTKVRRCLLN